MKNGSLRFAKAKVTFAEGKEFTAAKETLRQVEEGASCIHEPRVRQGEGRFVSDVPLGNSVIVITFIFQ